MTLEEARKVAHDNGYHLVKRSECVEVGARVVLSNELLMTVRNAEYARDYTHQSITRRLANEIAKSFKPKLLPRDSDAEVYETRLTILKPLLSGNC